MISGLLGKNVNANVFESAHREAARRREPSVRHGPRPHIDPVRLRPLIINFCRFFGLGAEVRSSRLAQSDFMKLATQGAMSQPSSSRSTRQQK
jgi:hypothetical protein